MHSGNSDQEGWSFALETGDAILDLAVAGPDLFLADAGPENHRGTVFGGRLLGQALFAAVQTVASMPLTSLHAYFLAAGQTERAIEYSVARLRDSRRFANRQVTARQDGRPIFTLMCQFHAPEAGAEHCFAAMPDVPPPEAVAPVQEFVRKHHAVLVEAVVRNFSGPLPIEMRPIAPERYLLGRPEQPQRDFWFRLPSATELPDPRMHQCLLAFASDYWLIGASAMMHVLPTMGDHLLMSSLDHSLWFHSPADCGDWLLHHTVSPAAGDGLSLTQGRIFDRQGRLVASTTQEALLRMPEKQSHT